MIQTLPWAMMPSTWILHEPGLRRFPVRQLGPALAGMKIYLAITAAARALPKEGLQRGEADLTYDQVTHLTGVARSQIAPGLRMLEGLLSVRSGRGRSPNRYRILGLDHPESGGWAKLPARYLVGNGLLQCFSPRRREDLNAMKLYYLLVALRPNDSAYTLVSHIKINELSGIPKASIRPAISLLLNNRLITLHPGIEWGSSTGANRYEVRGL